MFYIIAGLILAVIISVIVYCLTPPDNKPCLLDDTGTIWKRMYYNGKFCGYIRLYEESIYILEDIKDEGGNHKFEFKELLEEDYVS